MEEDSVEKWKGFWVFWRATLESSRALEDGSVVALQVASFYDIEVQRVVRVVSFGGRLGCGRRSGRKFWKGRVTSSGGAVGRGWEQTAPSTPPQTPSTVSSGIPTLNCGNGNDYKATISKRGRYKFSFLFDVHLLPFLYFEFLPHIHPAG